LEVKEVVVSLHPLWEGNEVGSNRK